MESRKAGRPCHLAGKLMNEVAIVVVSLILAMAAGLAYAPMACSAGAPTPAPEPVSVTDAVGEEVALEAYIIPAIEFTVDPGSIDFDTGGLRTVTITNTGAWDLSVTGSVTGLYADGLKLDGEPWSSFNATIKRDGHQEINVTLPVLESYPGVGESGTIIFWAAEAR